MNENLLGLADSHVSEMLKLGYNQSDIAILADISETTVSKILNQREHPEFSVSRALVSKLENAIAKACKKRVTALLPYLSIHILDHCASVPVTEELQSEIRQMVAHSLSNSFSSEKSASHLPKGVEGVVAYLGDDLYLVKLSLQPDDNGGDEADGLRLLIHELEHIIQRLRQRLPKRKKTRKTISYPRII